MTLSLCRDPAYNLNVILVRLGLVIGLLNLACSQQHTALLFYKQEMCFQLGVSDDHFFWGGAGKEKVKDLRRAKYQDD